MSRFALILRPAVLVLMALLLLPLGGMTAAAKVARLQAQHQQSSVTPHAPMPRADTAPINTGQVNMGLAVPDAGIARPEAAPTGGHLRAKARRCTVAAVAGVPCPPDAALSAPLPPRLEPGRARLPMPANDRLVAALDPAPPRDPPRRS
ncbi:hypothetical protein [Pseudooceanicola aestuarii]|uniref:hypothetical protein n=1 Tax=Pseudooceanicola aestuarii TaxID=2697319 RepID=UPI0013D72963|nr:hypothetical protein [Pseudooceanicola aestuarii]